MLVQRWCARDVDPKDNLQVVSVYGGAGIGKTRFCVEFLPWLQDQLKLRPGDYPEGFAEVCETARVTFVPVRRNGNAIDDEEAKLPPSVLLGLRVAGAWLSPRVRHNKLREWVFQTPLHPDTFTLESVLQSIAKASPGSLHILMFDEFQTCLEFEVSKQGRPSEKELLMTALLRELWGAAATAQGFVIPWVAGTYPSNLLGQVKATDMKFLPVPLQPLSPQSCRDVIGAIPFGEEWLGEKDFVTLLATVNRIPRGLERLARIVGSKHPEGPKGVVNYKALYSELVRDIQNTWNLQSVMNPLAESTAGEVSPACMSLLLAAAGVPVKRSQLLSPDRTLGDYEADGILFTTPLPQHLRENWGVDAGNLLHMPLAFADACVAAISSSGDLPTTLVPFLTSHMNFDVQQWSDFQTFAIEHHSFRSSVVSIWASRQGHSSVPTHALLPGILPPGLIGSRCLPLAAPLASAPTEQVWCDDFLEHGLPCRDGQVVDVKTDNLTVDTSLNRSAIDMVSPLTRVKAEGEEKGLVLGDAKHSAVAASFREETITNFADKVAAMQLPPGLDFKVGLLTTNQAVAVEKRQLAARRGLVLIEQSGLSAAYSPTFAPLLRRFSTSRQRQQRPPSTPGLGGFGGRRMHQLVRRYVLFPVPAVCHWLRMFWQGGCLDSACMMTSPRSTIREHTF